MLILVTGSTGQVGRHLVSQLHDAGHHVRALTRNAVRAGFSDSIDVVEGDLTDVATLENAFADVDAVHLITFGGDDGQDLANGAEIVALAERSGVSRATVLGGWTPTSVEDALRASSLGWTILQPSEFMSNALELAEEIRTTATVSMLATYPSAVVHEADIAGVAATALIRGGHEGQIYRVTGPEALTPEERTRILSEATAHPIAFAQLSEEAERERLRGYGYDEDYVEFGIQLATNPPAGADEVTSAVADVTGRPARTFSQWAREHADHFLPAKDEATR